MEPSLKEISHIRKDTFDFAERTEKDLETGTVLGVADIKGLYTKNFTWFRTESTWILHWKLQQKIEHL